MPYQTSRSARKLSTASKGTETLWVPDAKLFGLDSLNTPEGLNSAVLDLQMAAFASSRTGDVLSAAVTALLSLDSCVLPLILSSDSTINDQINKRLQVTFPQNAAEYNNSIASKMLDALQAFYFSIPPWEDETDLKHLHQTLCKIAPLLAATFDPDPPTLPTATSPTSPLATEEHDIPFLSKKHRRKKPSIVIPAPLDDKIQHDYGRQRSLDTEEALEMQSELLEEAKNILQCYISSLEQCHQHARGQLASRVAFQSSGHSLIQPESSLVAKGDTSLSTPLSPELFPRRSSNIEELKSPRKVVNDQTTGPAKNKSGPSQDLGHQMHHPIKLLNLLEDEIKNFGPWKVFLSGEALRNLRSWSKRDAHLFGVIKKKLQELSEGFFSRSNHKRLTGGDDETPVYEAKMTSDTRLIYIIDCVPYGTGEGVVQAIKVFGVYTHAQIDSRLWAAMAHWSFRQNSEHRRRCLARQKLQHRDDYVVPSSWPSMDIEFDIDTPELFIEEEVRLKLHALLTHEKFVPFTHAVLNGIMADEENAYPFSVSPREQRIIYHPSSSFVIGRSGTGKTTTMLFKMLAVEKTFRKLGRKPRQMFVTQSRVLAEKVQEYFDDLIRSCSADMVSSEGTKNSIVQGQENRDELLETEEEDQISHLPSRFSDLEESHFPLFVTFDKLCRLLEADCYSNSASSQPNPVHFNEQRILYEDFRSKYWPRLSHRVKAFDPALVWNEFQGVIRGSEISLQGSNGSLDRVTYESLSFRKQAAFASHRAQLYDLFEAYMRLKRERNEYDAADRTHKLLNWIQNLPRLPTMDYIYVDEVQDNLIIDAKLIRLLCHNPHGLYWAGDTAQQITSTAFRFSDLKSFLYRIEEEDALVRLHQRKPIHPAPFTLSINYRSHGGIINCAHSIIELLVTMWPESIDVLERERGLVDGPKPVFLSGWDGTADLFHSKEVRAQALRFGAEQCVLVRNNAAREMLRSQNNHIGLIMTLYESKGLEFNDVLLYNFFSDSVVQAEWRVILNAVQGKSRSQLYAPAFDELRHLGVSSELKFLYVGLTRARNRLWIWDSSLAVEPMKIFWNDRGLIETRGLAYFVAHWTGASTEKEWKNKGFLLYKRGNFEQAAFCFELAGEELLRRISAACHLKKLAEPLDTSSDERKQAFIKAASEFRACASSNYRQKDGQREICNNQAAKCYVEAGEHMQASDAFYEARQFALAALQARKAAAFDRALEIVDNHVVEEDVATTIKSVCKMVFLRGKEFEKARKLARSDDELLEQCRIFGFDRTPLLKLQGRLEDAADLLFKQGMRIQAVELFLKAKSKESLEKANKYLMMEWWRVLPFGACATPGNQSTTDLLWRLTEQIAPARDRKDELNMFRMVLQNNDEALLHLSKDMLRSRNIVSALRCLFHVFRKQQDIQAFSVERMHIYLSHLHDLGSYLRNILSLANPVLATSANTQKLLGYSVSERGSTVTVYSSSVIINYLSTPSSFDDPHHVVKITENGEYVILIEHVGKLVRNILAQEFVRIVENHCEASKHAKAFQQLCVHHLRGRCQNQAQCRRPHIPDGETKEAVNRRFRIFLHHFLVINDVPIKSAQRRLRRPWMSRLFDVLFPRLSAAGKAADIVLPIDRSDAIIQRGLNIFRNWLMDTIYSLEPNHKNSMLALNNANTMQELFLIAMAIDHYQVPQHIRRAFMFRGTAGVDTRPPFLLDMVNALFAHSEGAMECGVGYIRYILSTKTVVDAHAFVSILEVITTLLIIGLKRELHGLIIPQAWLFTLALRPKWPETKIFAYITFLLQPLMELVEDICIGCDYLLLDRHPIGEAYPRDRALIIERIFRCLIVAGCNYESENDTVRNTLIHSRISRLTGDGETYNYILGYVDSDDWDELVTVLVRNQNRVISRNEFIIQIIVKGNNGTISSIPGITQFSFSNEADILAPFSISPLIPSAHRSPSAHKSIPILQSPPKKAKGGAESTIKAPITTLLDDSQLRRTFSEVEHNAAHKIQLFYRNFRYIVEKKSKSSPLSRWYDRCNTASQTLQCARIYIMLLRGPLPHIFVCMDAYGDFLDKKISSTSELLGNEERQSLENTMRQLEELDASRTKLHQIKSQLDPESSLHQDGNIATLKANVKKAYAILKPFCDEREDLKLHLSLVHTGILEELERKAITRPKKPVLNTSDLLELDFL